MFLSGLYARQNALKKIQFDSKINEVEKFCRKSIRNHSNHSTESEMNEGDSDQRHFVLNIDNYGQYSPQPLLQSRRNDKVAPFRILSHPPSFVLQQSDEENDANVSTSNCSGESSKDDPFHSVDTVDSRDCRCDHDYRGADRAAERQSEAHAVGRCSRDKCILIVMMVLTLSFAVCELLFGFLNDSLALIADSFHMLSDAAALLVAMIAIRLATRPEITDAHSFGWQRAEIIGALINGVYLVSVCVYTVLEAIFRFVDPVELQNAWVVMIVGSIGFAINVVGVGLFFSHRSLAVHAGHSHGHAHNSDNGETLPADNFDGDTSGSGSSANMHGVFLHILGDLLGSVIVMLTALATIYVPYDWRVYFDPVCSILFSLIILRSSVPLIRHSTSILMQSTPNGLPTLQIKSLLLAIEGVLGTHELHIWQMAPQYNVATVHLVVDLAHLDSHNRIVDETNRIFCQFGIHRTTIQLEPNL